MADVPGGPSAPKIRPGALVGGIVLGVVASWFWVALTILAGYVVSGVSGTSDWSGWAVVLVGVAALPLLLGIVLLWRPRTRQMGAGFWMGLAIGMIAGAGVCGAGFVPEMFM